MKKIDVLFLNPRDLSVPVPYVRTASLAGVLLQKNINCKIIDPLVSIVSINDIINQIGMLNPVLICVSVFPSTLPDAYKTINQIRANFPSIKIMVEGYMVNADPKCVKELNADFGIAGDAEASIFHLYELVKKEEDFEGDLMKISGIIFFKKNKLFHQGLAFVRDLNTLPMPAYHLLPIGSYYSASTNKKYMVIFTDRGCPYTCSFCANINQKRYRYLSIENTISQITTLVNDLKVQFLEFMNLTFTINKKNTIALCNAIIENNLKFDWACETRADLVDEELLICMKKAGCQKITFGVESGSEKIRAKSGKNISNDQIKSIFSLCKKHGIKVMANFIIGHPKESASDVLKSINQSIKLDPFNVLFTKMTPLPDVDIYFEAVKNSIISEQVWYDYMKGKIPFPVIYPKTLGKIKMELLYRYAYIRFYLRIASIRKYLPLFSNFKFGYYSIKVFLRFVFGSTLYK